MANVPLSSIILEDRWPGQPCIFLGRPTGGWDNTTDNFTTTGVTETNNPKYPVGTKIVAHTDNTFCAGWYTMMYLSFHDYSAQDISADFSNGNFWCSHYDGSDAVLYQIDESSVPYYVVSRCYTATNTDITRGFPVAVPCATIASDGSAAYDTSYGDAFGWFWVGGVCPCADATLLQGLASDLAGADVSVAITRRGAIYAEMSGSSLVFRSSGDATALFTETNPQLGYSCITDV